MNKVVPQQVKQQRESRKEIYMSFLGMAEKIYNNLKNDSFKLAVAQLGPPEPRACNRGTIESIAAY